MSAKLATSGLIQQTVGQGFSSEHHKIKSAFRENILAMAQRIGWRRGTEGQVGGGRRTQAGNFAGKSRSWAWGSEGRGKMELHDNSLNKGDNNK